MRPERGIIITIADVPEAYAYRITIPGTRWLCVGPVTKKRTRVMEIPNLNDEGFKDYYEFLDKHFDGTRVRQESTHSIYGIYDIRDEVILSCSKNSQASTLLQQEFPW